VVESLNNGKEIKIVNDQINNPTFTDDLVGAINKIWEFKKLGVYNIGGPEFLSRLDFTIKIADYFNLDKKLIKQIETADLKQPAARPLKSGLIILKAESEFGYKPLPIIDTFRIMKNEFFIQK
jgi:dTDP-4-dehydrorhamnose reductase